ncbi:MAG: hypothetical protein NVS4B5_11630 [Vulcanimicrobiaceae bacterium]
MVCGVPRRAEAFGDADHDPHVCLATEERVEEMLDTETVAIVARAIECRPEIGCWNRLGRRGRIPVRVSNGESEDALEKRDLVRPEAFAQSSEFARMAACE